MKQFPHFLLLILLFLINPTNTTRTIDMKAYRQTSFQQGKTPIKIAFGSCFGQFGFTSDIFSAVEKYDPDIWIWLGDFAYADKLSFPKIHVPGDPEYISQRFLNTYNDQYYKIFREGNRIILGTMDDHDYGLNNSDKHNPVKDSTKNLFLKLLKEPSNSPRWKKGRGLYEDYKIIYDSFHIRIILLDTRYYMQKENFIFPTKTPPDFLGQEQWTWLEDVFKTTPKDQLTIIGSGVQFLQNNRYLPTQSWHQHQKIRLLDLIQKYERSNVIIITGDIHSFQIYKVPCPLLGPKGYYLYEMTSSGLTHVGKQIFIFSDLLLQYMTPKEYFLSDLHMEHNFGVIEINNISLGRIQKKEMAMQIRNEKNEVQIELKIDDLKQLLVKKQGNYEKSVFNCQKMNRLQKLGPNLINVVNQLFDGNTQFAIIIVVLLIIVVSFLISCVATPICHVIVRLEKCLVNPIELNLQNQQSIHNEDGSGDAGKKEIAKQPKRSKIIQNQLKKKRQKHKRS